MGLYFQGGSLLFNGGQLAMAEDCCCTGCDEAGLEALMGIGTTPLTATFTVDFPACTPVSIFREACELNSVTDLSIPYSALAGSGVTWGGSAIGRAGQYQCNAGPYIIVGGHLVTVVCDDAGVLIRYSSVASSGTFPGPQAQLIVPYSSFDPTDTHVLTPQAGIPCDIDFCSVTWS